jgi:hypothetical protein
MAFAVIVAQLILIVSPRGSVAQGFGENPTCEELWLRRNYIFARNGHCFQTAEAIAMFGKGCFPPFGQLSSSDTDDVNYLKALEVRKRCPAKGARWGITAHRPIMVGGHPSFDACRGTGEVVGLDPNGDGFLSVRTGPKGREIDRLHNGQGVYVCDRSEDWIGIVYASPGEDPSHCNVTIPWTNRIPNTGPCRFGWIHRHYLRPKAG